MRQVTLNIAPEHILAMKMVVPVNDARRPSYRGILFEIGRYETRMVGTDGFRLTVIRHVCTYEQINEGEVVKVVVPISLFDDIKLTKRPIEPVDLTVNIDDPMSGVSLYVKFKKGVATYGARPIEDDYPVWRRGIPTKLEPDFTQLDQFDPRAIGQFGAMSALYNKNPVAWISQNGGGAALIDIGHPDVLCILMPIRISGELRTRTPDWLNKPLSEKADSDLI